MRIRLIVLLLAVAAIGWLVSKKIQASNFVSPQQLLLSTASYADIEAAVFVSGAVSFATQARLSAEVVAKVTDILVQEGEVVQAGQILLKLDDTEIKKEIEQAEFIVERATIDQRTAKRQYDHKKLQVERLKQLASQRYVQKLELDQAIVELDLAAIAVDAAANELRQRQTELALAQSKAAKTIIRAPIAGRVMNIPIKKGETAVPSVQGISGSELLFIADPNSYQAEAFISEFDLTRVSLGQAVKVILRSQPDVSMTGNISKVGAVLQQSTAENRQEGVQLLIRFDNQAKQLIAGMNCDIEILQSSDNAALAVPLAAIYTVKKTSDKRYVKGEMNSHYVFVVKDNKIEQRPVELGLADGNKQQIRQGLKLNEQVISGPAALLPTLKTGMSIGALGYQLVNI
jgi:HlyD family secretion protein